MAESATRFAEGVKGDAKIVVGEKSPTGAELMAAGKEPESPTPEISTSKYGDPNAPAVSLPEMKARFNPRTGMPETGFYGHYLPSHFKKTTIISTKGRVR